MAVASSYAQEAAAVEEFGLHPEEAKPRDQSFIHERRNWEAEMEQTRAYAARLRAIADAARQLTAKYIQRQWADHEWDELRAALAAEGDHHNHADELFWPASCAACSGKPIPI